MTSCACDFLTKEIGGLNSKAHKRPPDAAVLTPWVRLKLKISDVMITVGNRSSPQNNHHAVIKDFEFGSERGLECRITIHDEQGSSFTTFMQNLLKNAKCALPASGYTMTVEFGWVPQKCQQWLPVISSTAYHMMLKDVTCNFSGGKFAFEITGMDMGDAMFEMRMDKVYGDDKPFKAPTVTEAIRMMLTDKDNPPSVASVRFLKKNYKSNSVEPLTFKEHDGDPKKGPKGKWVCNSLNKIDCALQWLKDWVTTDGKSVVPRYNGEVEGGEIIFWEDHLPSCGQSLPWDEFSAGTYVVNGGADSSVIEFNPRIHWDFSVLAVGGGMGDQKAMSDGGGKSDGPDDCKTLEDQPTAGSQTTTAACENSQAVHGADCNEKTSNAQEKQLKALKIFPHPIAADLVVIGDPTISAFDNLNRPVHIVFVNPYYIFQSSTSNSDEWLVNPVCNDILSNKGWFIRSINHRISAGSYTTTMRLELATPGIDIDSNQPIGGLGSCGWTPNTTCP